MFPLQDKRWNNLGLTLPIAGSAVGVVLGLFAAHAVTLLPMMRFQNLDLPLLAMLTLPLIAIALLAAYIPARRASRVDPMIALRGGADLWANAACLNDCSDQRWRYRRDGEIPAQKRCRN